MTEQRDRYDRFADLNPARRILFAVAVPLLAVAWSIYVIRVAVDYFDIVDLGGDRTAVVIADVAGKGMPAALLMALLQGSLRTLSTAGLRGADLVS